MNAFWALNWKAPSDAVNTPCPWNRKDRDNVAICAFSGDPVKYIAPINFYRDKVSSIESSSFIKFPLHLRQRRFDSDHSRKNFVQCYFILLCSYALWRPYVPYYAHSVLNYSACKNCISRHCCSKHNRDSIAWKRFTHAAKKPIRLAIVKPRLR